MSDSAQRRLDAGARVVRALRVDYQLTPGEGSALQLIIFDFDGVIADSEHLANQALADALTAIGLPTTLDQSLEFYLGRRWAECLPLMEQRLGAPLPDGFLSDLVAQVHGRVMAEVEPVAGLRPFLASVAHVRRCIGSSSGPDYIDCCLNRMQLGPWFEDRFSGQDVERGKPDPELFLKAAATLGVSPGECAVIEDSPMGVRAGKAAGMFTVGLCAGKHIRPGHPGRLAAAGADIIATDFAHIERVLGPAIAA